MNINNYYKGYIYCIINKVNNKMYIGRTVNYTQRKWQHFNNEQCPALKNAFAKYGTEHFEMRYIASCFASTKENLNSILNWLEKYYIERYDTYHNGYNSTKGGEGTCGNVLSEESKQAISNAQKAYKAQDWVKQKDRERMRGNTLNEEFKRPILKYDLLGNFIKEYSFIGEAIKDIVNSGAYTSNPRSIHSNIIRALNADKNLQPNNKAYQYMWRYKIEESFPLSIEPFRRKGEKPLFHYNKMGELLASYRTLEEAEIITGIDIKKLKYLSYNGDLRRKMGMVSKTDYWSRIPPIIKK